MREPRRKYQYLHTYPVPPRQSRAVWSVNERCRRCCVSARNLDTRTRTCRPNQNLASRMDRHEFHPRSCTRHQLGARIPRRIIPGILVDCLVLAEGYSYRIVDTLIRIRFRVPATELNARRESRSIAGFSHRWRITVQRSLHEVAFFGDIACVSLFQRDRSGGKDWLFSFISVAMGTR